MKILSKIMLAASLFAVTTAKADVLVPTPVYFNDFSFAVSGQDGIEIVGNGVFEDDADARFGRIFHNDPTLTKAIRTNYLKLPNDVLSHSGTSKEMTIGFWVNMKDAADFYWSPLFTAYDRVERASKSVEGEPDATWPKFNCLARKVVDINCWGYCDLSDAHNDNGANAVTSAWLDDEEWHYYTVTLTETTVKVYIDGNIANSWTVDGTSDAQVIKGIFEAGAAQSNDYGLKYICLGGNQSDNFNDPDPAFGFDDFAVYDVALTQAQINQIRANKLNRTVTGTKIGNIDSSSDYLSVSTSQIKLNPGDSYHYSFINYNNGGLNNWNNWIVPVYNASETRVITVRNDNYEDMHHIGETWGSNKGCTSDFNWSNWSTNMNGAAVNMTVSFTKDKKFTMNSIITAVDGSVYNYAYTNDYDESPIDLTGNDYIKVALSVSRSWIDVLEEGQSAMGVAIGSTGWATFCSDYALDFSKATDGLNAYMITGHSGNAVTLDKVTGTVPAGTPLLINGAEGSYSIPIVGSSSTDVSGNLLQRGTGTVSKADGYTRYVLYVNGGVAEFQKIVGTPATVGTDKAYLEFAGDVTAPALMLEFSSETTGISEVRGTQSMASGTIFNISGQRVSKASKGLYIVNGKKVIMK